MGLDSTRVGGTQTSFGAGKLMALRDGSGLPLGVDRGVPRTAAHRRQESAEDRAQFGPGFGMCSARARSEALTRVQLRAMAVEFPEVHGHPNRLPFEGVLTLVDVASDKAPSGSRGHRVVLTREAAETALPSLLGMAVGYKAGWDGHDARQKCGIITSAELDGRRLMVGGFLFARDFPEFGSKSGPDKEKSAGVSPLEGDAMGMSYELADAHVADMRSSIWTLTRATFTGAAILLREKAAYRSTSFRVKRPGCAGVRGARTKAH